VPLRFTDEEFAAASEAAKRLDVSLSGLLRVLGVAAGIKFHERAKDVPDALRQAKIIEWAADDAHMVVNEWLRVVTLSAIGYTALAEQLSSAGEALRAGVTVDSSTEDDEGED
jgi:hypothetical protein